MTAHAHDWLSDEQRRTQLETSELVGRLAVLASFDPLRIDDSSIDDVVRLCAARLQRVDNTAHWMLTESARVNALAHFLHLGGAAKLADLRRASTPHFDTAIQHALDGWILGPPWSVTSVNDFAVEDGNAIEEQLAACTHVYRWATSALQSAGHSTDEYKGPRIDDVESQLLLLAVTRPIRWLVRHPVIGRDRELERLREYLRAPSAGSLSSDPAFCVYGIGGIGKSTLVAAFVSELTDKQQGRAPWAYLDFDRRALDPNNPLSLVAEIYRQLGAQYSDYRREAERAALELKESGLGSGLESVDARSSPREAALQLASFAHRLGSKLVIVLDTCEEMQRHLFAAENVFDLFDALAAAHGFLKLVVSGRSLVPEFARVPRPNRVMAVGELAKDSAIEFLRTLIARAHEDPASATLDPDLAVDVVELVGGNPLTLSLAARVLVHDKLTTIRSAIEHAHALGRVRDEFVRGFLYRRVLDHLQAPTPDRREALRVIARASLALRHVTRDLIERVLIPVTGRHESKPAYVYGDLAAEVSFVDDTGSTLRIREDVRGPALYALRIEDAALVERVHAAAKRYYAENPTAPHARIELLYHSLALGHAAVLHGISEGDRAELATSTIGLPAASVMTLESYATDPALQQQLASEDDLSAWETRVHEPVDSALRSKDYQRARDLLFERTERTPASELYRLESRLYEGENDLEEAATAAELDLAASREAGHGERLGAASIRLAGLYERLGRVTHALLTLEEVEDAPMLKGNTALCLELLLNRMNLAERTQAWSDEQRWLPSLEARKYVGKLGARLQDHEALVRLLGAAFGRDESSYLVRALERVGLGTQASPERIDNLAAALAAWDAAIDKNLASVAGLPSSKIENWRDRVSLLGSEASDLLLKLWSIDRPPSAVTEAVRAIYLWWSIPFDHPKPAGDAHFLDEVPLDYDRAEAREFEDIVGRVFTDPNELMYVAQSIGMGDRINPQQTRRVRTRDVLKEAAQTGVLGPFVKELLARGPSLANRTRSLIGDDWLTRHGIELGSTGTSILDDSELDQLYQALRPHITSETRQLLLAGLPPALVASAPEALSRAVELFNVLGWLNGLPETEGDHPLMRALRNVRHLDEDVIDRYIARLGAAVAIEV
jgi:hypothetical protein